MKENKAALKLTKHVLLCVGLLLTQFELNADELDNRIDKIMNVEVDEEYAVYLAEQCTSCHQSEQNTGTPVIEAMAKRRIIISLLLYQNGSRINATMASIASGLGDEEIALLAEYFSQKVDSQ